MMELLGGKFSNLNESANFDYTPEGGGARRMSVSRSTVSGPSGSPLVLSDDEFTWDQNFVTKTLFAASESAALNPTNWQTIRGTEYRNTLVVGVMLAKLKYERRQELDSLGREVKIPGSYVDYVVSFAPNQLYDSRLQRWSNHVGTSTSNAGGQVHAEIFLAGLLGAFLDQLKGGTEQYTRAEGVKWVKEDYAALSAGFLTFDGHISIHSGSVAQVMCPACTGTWTTFTKNYSYEKKVGDKVQKFKSTFDLF